MERKLCGQAQRFSQAAADPIANHRAPHLAGHSQPHPGSGTVTSRVALRHGLQRESARRNARAFGSFYEIRTPFETPRAFAGPVNSLRNGTGHGREPPRDAKKD